MENILAAPAKQNATSGAGARPGNVLFEQADVIGSEARRRDNQEASDIRLCGCARAGTHIVFFTVDRDMCVAIMKRVRANMLNVIGLHGGNFYRD